MSTTVRDLQAKKAATVEAARALMSVAESADRDFSAEEKTQYDAMSATIQSLNSRIERVQAQELAEAGIKSSDGGRSVQVAATSVIKTEDNRASDPKGGFATFGQYLQAVRGAELAKKGLGVVDQRLLIGAVAPGTAANEMSGADGGFLVPTDYSTDIFTLTLDDQALLPMTDNVNVAGNSMGFPKDETTPWGTNGIRAYWQGELTVATPTKPLFGLEVLRLKKLMALTPISDELLADSTALSSYLPKKMATSIQWKTNEAILYGPGGPTPLGALSGSATVTVPKDNSQATGTVSALNLANMIARLPPGSYGRAVWLMNNDALPALFTLTLGNYPIYLPLGAGGSIQGSPYGMLLGRPIMVTQHAPSFSSAGDIALVDLSWYQAITKAEGVTTATSMHIYFDADAMAFRTTFRMDGQPKITTPITPAKSAKQLSPFVQLASR